VEKRFNVILIRHERWGTLKGYSRWGQQYLHIVSESNQNPPYVCCIAVIQAYCLLVHNTSRICIVLLLPAMHICVKFYINIRVLVQGWGRCRAGLVHAPRPKGARVREIIIAACMTVLIKLIHVCSYHTEI